MAGAEQQTNISIGVNASQFVDGMKSATAAAQQFETSIDKLGSTTQKTAQQVTVTAASYQKLVQSLDPAARSAALYAAAETKIQQAVTAGLTTREQANKLLDLANQKYNTLANQANQTAKAEADAAAKAAQAQATAYKQLEQSLDPTVASKQKLSDVEKTLTAAVAGGQTTQTRANDLLALAKTRYSDLGNKVEEVSGTHLFHFEERMQRLIEQSAASGNIFAPFTTLGPKAIFALGGVSSALTLLKDHIALVSGLAIGAALVTIAISAERSLRAINDLSNGLQKFGGDYSGTAQTINAAARQLAATTTLGTQEARDALKTLAENPSFARTQQNMVETAKTAKDFSVSFGETLQQSAQRIQQIFADPVAEALKYAQQQIAGFDDTFVRHITTLVNQGRNVQAVNEVYAKLKAAVGDVKDNVTPLQAALKNLNETLTAVGQSGGNATNGIGTGLTNALTAAVNIVTSLVKGIDSLLDSMSKLGVSANLEGGILLGIFAQLLSPIRAVEAGILRWAASFVTARVAAAGAAAAVEAATVGGAAVAGGAAAAGGGAVAGGAAAVTAASAIGLLGGATGIAAIAALVYVYFKNQTGQASFQDKAAAAGFQQYKTGTGLFAENPRYNNPRTGEDLSTEQMNQRLLGQTLADSFGTRLDTWFAKNMPATFFGGRTETGATPPTGGQITLNPLTNIPAAGQQYAPLFAASEQKYGLPTGTLAGIASIETGGTFNPNAANKTSSARGMMQILDSTATNPGYGITPIKPEDRFNPAISIDFAGQLLSKVAAANGGSLDKAIQVYSGGGYAPGGALKGVTLGQQAANTNIKTGTEPYTVQTQLEDAQHQALGTSSNADLIKGYQDQINHLEQLKQTAGLSADAIGGLNKQEEELRSKIEGLQSPTEKTVKAQQDQLKIENELNPATKAVVEAQTQLINANKQAGVTTTQAMLDAVKSGVLNQLASQYRGITSAADVEATSQERIAAAWDKGSAAAEHQMNAEKARQQVAGNSPTIDAAQAAAIDKVTASLDKQAEAAKHAQAAQQLLQAQSQGRLLDVQEANLGGSATQQAVANAQAQAAEQAKLANFNPSDTAKLVNQAGANAARTVNVDREKQAWATVDGAATSAIEDIGNGLETALSTGKWSDFAAAGKQALSEISKMLIELTLLNPLKNLLTGGRANAPSLFDLFNNNSSNVNPLNAGAISGGNTIAGGSSSGGGLSLGGLFSSFSGLGSVKFGGTDLLTGFGNILSGSAWDGMAAGSTLAGLTTEAASTASAFSGIGAVGGIVAIHSGGVAGQVGGNMHGGMPLWAFTGASRFHSGGMANDNMVDTTLPPSFAADEIPAVLRRNELVLTQAQQRAVSGRLNQSNMKQPVINQHFNISTPDADSFRASKSQVQTEMARAMVRASRRL